MRRVVDVVLVVLAVALTGIGVVTHPDVHPLVVLAALATGLALVVPAPGRASQRATSPVRN